MADQQQENSEEISCEPDSECDEEVSETESEEPESDDETLALFDMRNFLLQFGMSQTTEHATTTQMSSFTTLMAEFHASTTSFTRSQSQHNAAPLTSREDSTLDSHETTYPAIQSGFPKKCKVH